MTGTIKISLTTTNFLTRWPCHVCGGTTEKHSVLAEGEQDLLHGEYGAGPNEYRTVRVCGQCLNGADGLSIDQRLENHVRMLEDKAKLTRALIGNLQVPSYAEWEAACREIDDACREDEALREVECRPHPDEIPF